MKESKNLVGQASNLSPVKEFRYRRNLLHWEQAGMPVLPVIAKSN
ncbi:MAG: hypothetical protein AB1393_05575 [Candidatus Edwardsbacteria bacterium]